MRPGRRCNGDWRRGARVPFGGAFTPAAAIPRRKSRAAGAATRPLFLTPAGSSGHDEPGVFDRCHPPTPTLPGRQGVTKIRSWGRPLQHRCLRSLELRRTALGRFCSALAVVTSRSGGMVDGRGIMFPAGGGDCPIGDILNLFVGLLVLFGQIADLGRL